MNPLFCRHLHTLLSQLKDVSHRWYLIGLELHLTQPQLSALEEDHRGKGQDRHLIGVLQKWLQQCYKTDKFGKPSWRVLVQALEVVDGCKPTAQQIKKQKPWKK